MPPIEGRPLILYLTVLDNSMGYVLGQHDESDRKEHAIYYLRKKFTDCQKSWVQLKEERNSLETSLHASEKKVLELTRLLHEERTLNTYIAPKRMRNVFLH